VYEFPESLVGTLHIQMEDVRVSVLYAAMGLPIVSTDSALTH
jgi:hypothetical protein